MKEKDKYFRYFIIISIIIISLSIASPIIINHFFHDWTKSGTFGDTYGALNAVFSGIAIAGLIVTILIQRKELKNQQIELSLQRTEMQETRKEFSINRITNVVYSQLDRFEKAVEQFKILSEYVEYIGYEAIFHLDSLQKRVPSYIDDTKTEEEILKEKRSIIIPAMTLYSANDKAIAQFALSAYNSTKVVEEVLVKSELTIKEINDLKNLYFRNIGFIHIGVLEDIYIKFKEFIELPSSDEDFLAISKIELGKLNKAQIFLKSILKFRETIFSIENLKEIKSNWTQEFGSYA